MPNYKQFLFGKAARDELLAGVKLLADCVSVTLGPKGRNVCVAKKWVAPAVLHDGVSVSVEVNLENQFQDQGAQLVKEAASRTNDLAGDGTTTATLLAYKLVEGGMKLLDDGVNPATLKKGMDYACGKVIEELKKISKPVKSKEEIAQVGTVSSSDPFIGNLVAEAMEKVGKDGVVTVEEGGGTTTTVDYKTGMEFDKGYISPYFVTNKDKMECEIAEPYVLLTDQRITNAQELYTFLKKFLETGHKELLIICEDLDGDALTTLSFNVARGAFTVVAVKAPYFADRRNAILEDIAIYTGGTVITRESGKTLENAEITDLGKTDKVWVDASNTKIIGGHGNPEEIAKRITQIKNEISKSNDDFDKEKIQERLAKLTGGAAILKVGAPTEQELKEKKERVVDAVEACKAGVEEGVVMGGGMALQVAGMFSLISEEKWSDDFQAGVNLVNDVLVEPFRKLIENAGGDFEKTNQMLNEKYSIKDIQDGYGYDVEKEEFGNLYELGIVDPVKVTRLALENSASVAGMILSTDCLIVNIPERETGGLTSPD